MVVYGTLSKSMIVRKATITDANGIIELLNPIILGGQHSAMTELVDIERQK